MSVKELNNIELSVGNGIDLSFIETGSVDFVYSFGALTHMPVIVFAGYLLEVSRIVKIGGNVRIQIFLGRCDPFVVEDTSAYRSFQEGAIVGVLQGAGFGVEWIEELKLATAPCRPDWLRPHICALVKRTPASLDAREIEEMLVPSGEARAGADWPGSFTEYILSLTRAQQFAKAGMENEAQLAFDYAKRHYLHRG